MFSTKQIFIFSLVPLFLAFAGVIGGSVRTWGGSTAEIFPTPGPQPPPISSSAGGGPSTGGAAGANVLQITAKNLAFDKRSLTAPPNAPVTVQLINQDAGVSHNFSVYQSNRTTKVFVGDLITGPTTMNYTFTTPATPGNYFFRCDAHPDQMNGTFTVK